MSKEKKQEQKKPFEGNPLEYQYESGQRVEIEGAALLDIITLLDTLLKKETHFLMDAEAVSKGEPAKLKPYITPEGNTIRIATNYLLGIHIKNIEDGKVKKKSKFTFVNNEDKSN